MPRLHLIADLDGTLADTMPAILHGIARTVREAGGTPGGPDALRARLEPTLHQTFAHWLPADRIEAAVPAYRAWYRAEGHSLETAFPGVIEFLDACRAQGVLVDVVTGKHPTLAEQTLGHLGLRHKVEQVAWAGPANDKVTVFAAIRAERSAIPLAIALGDAVGDIRAAVSVGIPAIGVSYGLGLRDELLGAGASAVVDHINAVLELIVGYLTQSHTPRSS